MYDRTLPKIGKTNVVQETIHGLLSSEQHHASNLPLPSRIVQPVRPAFHLVYQYNLIGSDPAVEMIRY